MVVLSALLGSLAMTMVWGRKPASWFPFLVWEGLWGVGWWFDNWIVDASIHLPVRGGCVSVAIPLSLFFVGWWGVACFSVIICDNTCSVVWG